MLLSRKWPTSGKKCHKVAYSWQEWLLLETLLLDHPGFFFQNSSVEPQKIKAECIDLAWNLLSPLTAVCHKLPQGLPMVEKTD